MLTLALFEIPNNFPYFKYYNPYISYLKWGRLILLTTYQCLYIIPEWSSRYQTDCDHVTLTHFQCHKWRSTVMKYKWMVIVENLTNTQTLFEVPRYNTIRNVKPLNCVWPWPLCKFKVTSQGKSHRRGGF